MDLAHCPNFWNKLCFAQAHSESAQSKPSHTFNDSKKMRLISAEVFFYISENKSLFNCCLGKVPVLGPVVKWNKKQIEIHESRLAFHSR